MNGDSSAWQSTTRFSGLADVYSQCRPNYPHEALQFIVDTARLSSESQLVDVGCGTGISSQAFAAFGIPVIGIEPNADMRQKAKASNGPEWTIRYQAGTAEVTGLPDSSVDAVVAAQAFHWFDAEKSLREFHRILRPGGYVALIWNQRDNSDSFTTEYGKLFCKFSDPMVVNLARSDAGKMLFRSPLFMNGLEKSFPHSQTLDSNGLIGRAFSASYAPKETIAREDFRQQLMALFRQFAQGQQVTLCYETAVLLAQKADITA